MSQLKLVIANKNISSWSLRPWLLCKEAGIPFEEELVQFGAADWKSRVTSPTALLFVITQSKLNMLICSRAMPCL